MTTDLDTLIDQLAEPGRPLPAQAYSDPGLYRREVERIFAQEWLLVARADELPEPGDRYMVDIVGEPVVIVRDSDDELRAFSGVCRHRYFPVAEPGFGRGRRLTCAYHRWSYGLDGRCVAAPLMDDTDGFDRSTIRLPELALATWEGFVFVNLDPDTDFGDRFVPISRELDHHRLAEQRQTTRYDELWNGNWKAAVENGSESYHHVGLHSQTVQPFIPAQGSEYVGGTDHYAWHRTPIARFAERHGSRLADADTGLTDADREFARFFTLFPSTVISVVGDSVDWLTFLPDGLDRVRAIGGFVFRTWAIDDDELDTLRATQVKMAARINDEDRESVERLQEVVGSRFATRSSLNPREGVLSAFSTYLHGRLRDGG